ncbi:hypothetical protein [Comamonas sp. wu1-DMT]|uniref:hypothetical protein n=1 Tax=Comamonas sp. wu1-DMT TaxID=3126390 RepID=UPI0032E4F4DB
MNARIPVYAGPSANPHADAERWENEVSSADELHEEAQRQAPLIVLAALQAIAKPGDWFKDKIFADHSWSADEVMHEAVACDDDSADAYTELMLSPSVESMQKLKQRIAEWFGKKNALAVYAAHMESLQ